MSRISGSIRVLHVDDDPDLAETVATFVEREDEAFAVETTTSADEGLDRLRDDEFDCIISDYDMPGQNGIEFLEAVRESHPDLPFVLYTGKGSEEIASDAISAGVTDYLQKGRGTSQYTVLANRIRNAVEQYHTQSALAEREQRLNLFFEQSPLGVIEWNDSFELRRMNDAAEDILGYEQATLAGEPWDVIVPESKRETVRDVVSDLLENAGGYHSINENLRGDGEAILCEWHNRVITDDGGEVLAVFSQFQDITERKEREARFRDLNETAHRLMTATSRERISELGVEAARDVLGLEANAIHLYEEDTGLVPVAQTAAVSERIGTPPTFTGDDSIAWRVYEQGEPLALDDVHDDPDIYNSESELQSELYLPLGEYGILIAASETAETFDQQDIVLGEILAGSIAGALEHVERTKRLRAREHELTRQNDRLEEFASIVSHDLRNPLRVAEGQLELARDECDSDRLDSVARAHERMNALIEDLLTLARDGEMVGDTDPIDLASLTETCWQNVATADATLTTDVEQTIQADQSRLQQLLENLVRNAVEHGGEDVSITVGALDDGFYVEDDGPGIPEDERDDVFDAGYSTAEDGTGFGLSIVKQVAHAHGWDVHVTDGSDGGVRFEITGVEFAAA